MILPPIEAAKKITELNKEIGRLKTENYGYRETLKRYGFRRNFDVALLIDKKDEEIESLKNEIKKLNDSLRERVRRSESDQAMLEKLKEQNADMPRLRQELEALIFKLELLERENEVVQKENLSLKNRPFSTNTTDRSQVDAMSREIHSLEAKLVESDRVIAFKTNKLNLLEEDHKKLSDEVSALRRMETSLKNQVFTANENILELRKRLRERNAELESAKEEIEHCNELIRNYEEVHEELESGGNAYGPLQDLQQQIRGCISILNETILNKSLGNIEPSHEACVLNLKVAKSFLNNVARDLEGEEEPLEASQKEISAILDQKEDADDSLLELLRNIPKTPKASHRRYLHKKKPSLQGLETSVSVSSNLYRLRHQVNQMKEIDEAEYSVCSEASVIGEITMSVQQKSVLHKKMLQTINDLESNLNCLLTEKPEKRNQCTVTFAKKEDSCSISKDMTCSNMSEMDDEPSAVFEENCQSVSSVPDEARISNIPIFHSTATKNFKYTVSDSTICANNSAQFDGKPPLSSLQQRLEQELERISAELENERSEHAELRFTCERQQKVISELEEKIQNIEQDLEDWQITCEEHEKLLQSKESLLENLKQTNENQLEKLLAKDEELEHFSKLFEEQQKQFIANEEVLRKCQDNCERIEKELQTKKEELQREREMCRDLQRQLTIREEHIESLKEIHESEKNLLNEELNSKELQWQEKTLQLEGRIEKMLDLEEEMRADNKKLQSMISCSREEEKNLLNKIEDLTQKREDGLEHSVTGEKYKKLKSIVVAYKTKILNRTNELDNALRDLDRLQNELNNSNEEVAVYAEKLSDISLKFYNLKAKTDRMQHTIAVQNQLLKAQNKESVNTSVEAERCSSKSVLRSLNINEQENMPLVGNSPTRSVSNMDRKELEKAIADLSLEIMNAEKGCGQTSKSIEIIKTQIDLVAKLQNKYLGK